MISLARGSLGELSVPSQWGLKMDEEFGHPRLAAVYDALDSDRSDLLPYLDAAAEFGATRVLDLGCGTGVLALLLAGRDGRSWGWALPQHRWQWLAASLAQARCDGSMEIPALCLMPIRASSTWSR
jgi:SAM-dependent methyltransferase